MPSGNDIIFGVFVYLAIGSTLWMLLDSGGLLRAQMQARAARGKPVSIRTQILAIGLIILSWPKVIVVCAARLFHQWRLR